MAATMSIWLQSYNKIYNNSVINRIIYCVRYIFAIFVVMKSSYLSPAQEQWLKRHPELTATGSMLRRSPWHDYCAPCIYMITLVVEGRSPILGTLCDPDEEHPSPWVKLSVQGVAVKEAWQELPRYHPQVRLLSLCIMPDHIHGILYVTQRLPRHLGHIINGFKKGCRDRVQLSEAPPRNTRLPWQQGYHDRILTHRGQLATLFRYIDDNPRRLWLKRNHREYFTIIKGIEIAGHRYNAMGNIEILKHPFKREVQCSRSLNDTQINDACVNFMSQAAGGTVLVSPCISPSEKAIMAMSMQLEYPVIIIKSNGFNTMEKPSSRFVDACSSGNVLFIAPIEHHPQSDKLSREQCLKLNELARTIASIQQ